jgi:hypothetical protein
MQPRGASWQRKLQAPVSPTPVRTVLASLTQRDCCSRQTTAGSQVSAPSTRPLPQPTQSVSVEGVQRVGQKPSPLRQGRGISEQTNVQRATSPVRARMVSVSLLHAPSRRAHSTLGSQVSPGSSAPLSQTAPHSGSLVALQLWGQQLSPAVQLLMGSFRQRTLQAAGLPSSTRRVQDSAGQLVGQLPGGSQVS